MLIDQKLAPKVFLIEVPEKLYRMKDLIISAVSGGLDKNTRIVRTISKISISPQDSLITKQKMKVTESSLCNIILPSFTFLHWINFCHDSFQYQKDEGMDKHEFATGKENEIGVIRHVKGSILRKILGGFGQTLILLHIIGSTKIMETGVSGHVKTMFKIMMVSYVCYYVAGYRFSWFKFLDISKIFNAIRKLETEFGSMGGNFPKPEKVKILGWILVGLYFTISIAFTFVNRLTIGNWLESGFYHFLHQLSSAAILELNLLFDMNVEVNTTQSSVAVNSIIAIPFIFFSFLYDFTWVFGFLMNFLWGIIFSWIFKVFFQIISTRKVSPENTLQDIRKFNEITFVIESFNDAFSIHTLAAILAGSIHFSVFVLTFFTADDQRGLLPIMTALSFTIFWIQLFACAHVSYSAHGIGTVIKRCYQTLDAKRCGISTGMSTEMMQGAQIIFFELLAAKTGIHGGGFFTVTYSFIGTVLSMITTYSLVVLQFKDSSQN